MDVIDGSEIHIPEGSAQPGQKFGRLALNPEALHPVAETLLEED